MLYNNLSGYLKLKYGGKIGKICIDGGFSCPNRDGKCSVGGCIFCGERGAGEHIDHTLSIREQVEKGLAIGKKDGYIAYFQNFTNTYAPLCELKKRYDAALISDRIKILAIGTRPDCITEKIADLIASYKSRLDVWVELGLQSASDSTAEFINRGYKTEKYFEAARLLRERGIPFVTHMIIGLPEETEEDIDKTVDAVNSSGSFGVKIHSLYVSEGTKLADIYRAGSFSPISAEEYAHLVARALARLSPDIIVHRLTGDCPRGMLVAPSWVSDKNKVLSSVNSVLKLQGLKQGSLYKL